jgi:hypothetical protein
MQYAAKHYRCSYRKKDRWWRHQLQKLWLRLYRTHPRYHRSRAVSSIHSMRSSSCRRRSTRHRAPWHRNWRRTSWGLRVSSALAGSHIDLDFLLVYSRVDYGVKYLPSLLQQLPRMHGFLELQLPTPLYPMGCALPSVWLSM